MILQTLVPHLCFAWGYVESDDCIPIAVESSSFSRDGHAEMERIAEGL